MREWAERTFHVRRWTIMERGGRFLRRLFHLLVFVAIVCGAGAAYQAWEVSAETQKFPPPGQLVDIGGRRLHLLCVGEGAPIVLFESSGLGSAVSADRVRNEIAKQTRVCSYDRRGMGWSDPGPSGPITVNQFVDECSGPFGVVANDEVGNRVEVVLRVRSQPITRHDARPLRSLDRAIVS